jgi:hypothetical protein
MRSRGAFTGVSRTANRLRIRRRDLARLSDGGNLGPEGADLDRLVAAATTSAHPRELAGERPALAAFVAAHDPAALTNHRRPRVPIPSLVAKSIAVKIGVGAAALSLGGVAYAAHEGSLPDPAQAAAHNVFGSVGVPAANEAATGQGPDATGPAAVGLCRAFTAGEKDAHGEALDSTAFQALATAAGGEDQIEAYCEQVLADAESHPPAATPPAVPSSSHVPSEPGTQAPTDHPTGPPDTLPTDHPTGPPSDIPSGGH